MIDPLVDAIIIFIGICTGIAIPLRVFVLPFYKYYNAQKNQAVRFNKKIKEEENIEQYIDKAPEMLQAVENELVYLEQHGATADQKASLLQKKQMLLWGMKINAIPKPLRDIGIGIIKNQLKMRGIKI